MPILYLRVDPYIVYIKLLFNYIFKLCANNIFCLQKEQRLHFDVQKIILKLNTFKILKNRQNQIEFFA